MKASAATWSIRVHDFAIGVLWGLGALALVRHGMPEMLSREIQARTGSESAEVLLLGFLAGAECWIALALLTSSGMPARVASIVAMAMGTVWLVVAGMRDGWDLPCGCFEGIWESSIAFGILRNLVLLGWTLIVLLRISRGSKA